MEICEFHHPHIRLLPRGTRTDNGTRRDYKTTKRQLCGKENVCIAKKLASPTHSSRTFAVVGYVAFS